MDARKKAATSPKVCSVNWSSPAFRIVCVLCILRRLATPWGSTVDMSEDDAIASGRCTQEDEGNDARRESVALKESREYHKD